LLRRTIPNIVSTSLAGTQASLRQQRTALITAMSLVVTALIAAPFAATPAATAPSVQAIALAGALCLWSLSAYVVFSQAAVVRSVPLLWLGAGCFWSALLDLAALLAFPGIFGARGVFGHDHSAVWLWWFAMFGFVLCAAAFTFSQSSPLPRWKRGADRRFAAGTLFAALVIALIAISLQTLPAVGPFIIVLLVLVCAAGLVYCGLVTRARSALDVWLMVTLLALLCEASLTAFSNDRYTVGWYLARADGVVASGILMAAFLSDLIMLSGRLAQMAAVDPVCGLANRRALDERMQSYVGRRRRHGDVLSLIMLDIDHFKAFNDRYGHAAGDACLRSVADIIRAALVRGGDFAARYGGEEFVVVLPSTDRAGALVVAERIRGEVERLSVVGARSISPVTVSLGVVTVPSQFGVHVERLLRAADQALYAAKAAGRNCIVEASALVQRPGSKGARI